MAEAGIDRARGAFAGKAVAITGAASGIGRALAERFAGEGARLALLDVDEAGVARVAEELRGGGAQAIALACDIRDAARCEDAMAAARRTLGGIDVLVNNAGISHRSFFAETDVAVIRRVMEVNFFGAVNCTKAALESIVARKGQIVAISSVAGFAPLLGRSGYAASKHALHGFFDTLRAELAESGVSVLVVCPSFVRTAIDANAMAGDGRQASRQKATVGRQLAPEEVAEAVVRAAAGRRRSLVLSPVGKASWWLSRLLPSVYERVMRRTQEREFATLGNG